MESSPLTKAHDHARAAAIATHTSDTTVAIAEHAQAAGEFANASKSTNSVEALRTLRLLEQHHRRLSELLKLPVGPPSHAGIENDIPEEDEKEGNEQDGSKTTRPPCEPPAAKQPAQAKPVPTLSHQRYPGRNLSSSIASNLASARGIRARYSTQPLTPSVSNDQAPGSLEVHPRREGSARSKGPDPLDQARKPSWVPPVIKEDSVSEPPKSPNPEPGSPAPSEDGFSRFYSTFGSLINRLSAPLAFAGLPLIAEESAPASSASPAPEPAPRRPRHRPSSSSAEPDLSKIYSRATLHSLARDGHGPNDSFYVVPTSGHTASYASILNHENKEKRRMAASLHRGDGNDDNEDDDDFVDARESQVPAQPLSPTLRKRLGSRSSRSDKDLRNMLEELQLENASLKDVLDKVSKRLHSFELNSQTSHLALARSLRLQRPGSPLSSSGGGGQGSGGDEVLRKRNRELEEQLTEMGKRMAELERDHVKLQQTVEKYRERWEKLKAGAKARREAQGQANDGEGSRK
ncbi:MIT domain-containing protein [Madurella fahalii]|uniref:MIT domain-containing protein n=1 Tax=Madurella fahalii TaxID=1157608 RepID=A0ABQ0GG03_9PEZI